MGSLRVWWSVVLLSASWTTGQEPVPAAAAEEQVLRVAIEVVAEGEPKPRVPAQDGAEPVQAFRLEGRRLRWRIGSRTFEDGEVLRRALAAICNDPRRRVPDPTQPGGMRVPPLVIEAADNCRWNDLVLTRDAGTAAKFELFQFAEVGEDPTPWFPVSVADPVRSAGESVVPVAHYSAPDEVPYAFRPELHVAQDGTVVFGEEVLVRPGEPPAVDRLSPRLTELAAQARAEAHGDEEQADPAAPPQVPLLLHADRWAPWPVIRRVARAVNQVEPRFGRVEFAVGERDYEALLQQGERF